MAYGKTKDLANRTQSDKVLRDKAFKIASDRKYDGYQRGLASMFYKLMNQSGVNKPKLMTKVEVVLMNQIISWQMSFINRLFKNSKKERFIHLLETIFGVLI